MDGVFPPLGQLLPEGFDLAAQLRRLPRQQHIGPGQLQAVQEEGFAVQSAQAQQLVLSKGEQGAAQRRQERDILARVVNGSQQAHHGPDFQGLEIARASISKDRDGHLFQRLLENSGGAGGGPQQDHDVAVAQRAHRLAVGDPGLPAGHHVPDPVGHVAGFQFDARQILQLLGFLSRSVQGRVGFHQVDLDGLLLLRIISGAENQGLLLGVVQLAGPLAHDGGEHGIDGIQHFRAGAEIAVEQNFAPGAVPFIPHGEETAVLAEEYVRLGLTEAVDALLDVPHHEDVLFLPRYGSQDGFLHFIGVLIFVDQNFLEALLIDPGGFRRTVAAAQDAQGEVLQIGEINPVEFPFFALEAFMEGQGDLGQSVHHRSHGPDQGQVTGLVLAQQLADEAGVELLVFVAQAAHPVLVGGFTPDGGLAGEGHGLHQGLELGIVIALLHLPGDADQFFQLAAQERFQLGGCQLIVQGSQADSLLSQLHRFPGYFPDFPYKIPEPLCLLPVLLREIIGSSRSPDPGAGVSAGAGEAPEALDQVLQIVIGAVAAEAFRQFQEGRIPFLICFFQHFSQGFADQHVQFVLVQQLIIGIQVYQVEVFFNDFFAEGVDGHDAGLIEQGQLPEQVLIFRLGFQGQSNPVGDALAHFRGRRPGKGHHQQAVNVHRGILSQHGADAFNQNGRFAGAGCRGHQQGLIPVDDGLLLFIRPIGHGPHLLVRCGARLAPA